MAKAIRIRRGLDIKLVGTAEKVYQRLGTEGDYSFYPSDFPTVMPRLLVHEGDAVKAGTPLFCDKRNEAIRFCSSVSGVVKVVERGERRHLDRIVVTCTDSHIEYEEFGAQAPASLEREDIVVRMLEGGVWPLVRQRPFNVIANPQIVPRDIFISTFDTAPLAPDLDFAIKDDGESFQVGLDVLARLTSGAVHLGVNAKYPPHKAFASARGVKIHEFSGPHPAGNVGVQLHWVAPVSKGEVVWTLHPLDVVIIGRLFATGRYDARRIVAVAGSVVRNPRYCTAMVGSPMAAMLHDQIDPEGNVRIVSGNVLCGQATSLDGGLHFYDSMVTVLREGNRPEFMGWAMPGFGKCSASRLFPAFLMPWRRYDLDTNLHGGRRAFVVSGQYERVFPMDIYPVHLIKAILADDIEGMENLGIYEVAEEDFALCDFVCTSKMEAQSIVREGLNRMIRELN